MKLTVWTYEGPPHVGAMRVATIAGRVKSAGLLKVIIDYDGTLTAEEAQAAPLAALTLLAVLLSPTDAALGQAVLNSQAVPEQIREGLNVESGLNDGLATPVVLGALGVLVDSPQDGQGGILSLAAQPVLVGLGVGVVVGDCPQQLAGRRICSKTNPFWRPLFQNRSPGFCRTG